MWIDDDSKRKTYGTLLRYRYGYQLVGGLIYRFSGVTDDIATKLAIFLGFTGDLIPQCATQVR